MKSNYLVSIPSCICQGKALGLFFITSLHFDNKLFVSLKLVLYKVEVLVAMCLSYTHIVVPFFFAANIRGKTILCKAGGKYEKGGEAESCTECSSPSPRAFACSCLC